MEDSRLRLNKNKPIEKSSVKQMSRGISISNNSIPNLQRPISQFTTNTNMTPNNIGLINKNIPPPPPFMGRGGFMPPPGFKFPPPPPSFSGINKTKKMKDSLMKK